MKSEHIYIDKKGVPCAVMELSENSDDRSKTIQIREEDHRHLWSWILGMPVIKKLDTFYIVEPYQFEVFETNSLPGVTRDLIYHARIIRPSEPKADPKEKELYSIRELKWYVISSGEIEAYRADTLFGSFEIVSSVNQSWSLFIGSTFVRHNSIDEAKQGAQDHFNSKLKLCLNREL